MKETLNTHIDYDEGVVEIIGEAGGAGGQGTYRPGKASRPAGEPIWICSGTFWNSSREPRWIAKTLMEDLMVTSDEVTSAVKGYMKRIVIREESWDGEVFSVKGSMSLKEIDKLLKSFVNRGK